MDYKSGDMIALHASTLAGIEPQVGQMAYDHSTLIPLGVIMSMKDKNGFVTVMMQPQAVPDGYQEPIDFDKMGGEAIDPVEKTIQLTKDMNLTEQFRLMEHLRKQIEQVTMTSEFTVSDHDNDPTLTHTKTFLAIDPATERLLQATLTQQNGETRLQISEKRFD